MLRLFILICLFTLLNIIYSFSQNTTSFDIGLEVQAYPTGVIPGIHLEWGLSDKDGLQARLGYNVVRHRDLGVHGDEKGGGFGFTLGYRRYFKDNRNGFFLGARSDFWFNKMDWKDNVNQSNEVTGQSDIIVFQPTAEAGYVFNIGDSGVIFVPSIAFGAEINVKTDGAEVGEGAILLLGFTFGKRF